MQPEQQQQPQSSQNSTPLPYQVPDYLHLDPVTGQQKKKNKKAVVVASLLLVVILISGGIYIYMQWQRSVLENGFYAAFENAMSVKYVTQTMDATTTNKTTNFSVVAKSDFSDPRHPQSQSHYSLDLQDQNVGNIPKKVGFSGDVIFTNHTDSMVRFSQFPSYGQQKNQLNLNQWYTLSRTDTAAIKNYDILNLRAVANSPFTSIVFGNMNADDRTKIINYIKTNKTYDIKRIGSDKVNNRSATTYVVGVTNATIAKLDSYAASLMGQTAPSPSGFAQLGNLTEATLWVDDASHVVTKAVYSFGKTTENQTAKLTVAYTYPASLQIEVPNESTSLTKN